mmetsp:Transcript_3160/g.5186  ORF Transcript_3160/g.5186 Transcript_3160/m.5186 type:complete len:95 (+) Transcript_3160:1587-1871(+)
MNIIGGEDDDESGNDVNICSNVARDEATELVTKATILIPICRTLINQRQTSAAKKALELFRSHIADPATLAGKKAHPVVIVAVPIMMTILRCCS